MRERDTRKIDKLKYQKNRRYFILSSKELEVLAHKGGDQLAKAELIRRSKKSKRKSRMK
jgi:hypothetical protein